MAVATRIDYRIATRAYKDEACVRARYTVEGTDQVMIALGWMSSEFVEDDAVVNRLLESMDQQAEEDAAHPDDILTAEVFCT